MKSCSSWAARPSTRGLHLLDGTTGNIYGEAIKTVPATISGDFECKLMGWRMIRQLGIHTNADTPKTPSRLWTSAQRGIGLTRTEHMFFGADRIRPMRKMILSKTEGAEKKSPRGTSPHAAR